MRFGRSRTVERAQSPDRVGCVPGAAAEPRTRSRTTSRQLAARDAQPGGASDDAAGSAYRMAAAEARAVDGGA
jgi:hypothetical protein